MAGSTNSPLQISTLGKFDEIARTTLVSGPTPLEAMPNLANHCGGPPLLVKRDDCTGLAFGGNKVRQLEFYFGEALASEADTVLITGAVQSNYVRTAAAAANKLGMSCHIQQEERVARDDHHYHHSGNVFLDKMLGATLYSYPDGEDEEGADRQLGVIADELRAKGSRPYIIPLAFGHPPLGALGYIVAAIELLEQIKANDVSVDHVCVASGSGVTHAGLLFGLRAMGSPLPVTGACVRRNATDQFLRIKKTAEQIAKILKTDNCVNDSDIVLSDQFLAPGYGEAGPETLEAIVLSARYEGLLIDPVYTAKAMATTIEMARVGAARGGIVFVHTGGIPAIWGYQKTLENAVRQHA